MYEKGSRFICIANRALVRGDPLPEPMPKATTDAPVTEKEPAPEKGGLPIKAVILLVVIGLCLLLFFRYKKASA
jgi:hypothetical protein